MAQCESVHSNEIEYSVEIAFCSLCLGRATSMHAHEHWTINGPQHESNRREWEIKYAARSALHSISIAMHIASANRLIAVFGLRNRSCWCAVTECVACDGTLRAQPRLPLCVRVPCNASVCLPLILCIRSEISKRECIQQTPRSWHRCTFPRPDDSAFSVVFTLFGPFFSGIDFNLFFFIMRVAAVRLRYWCSI